MAAAPAQVGCQGCRPPGSAGCPQVSLAQGASGLLGPLPVMPSGTGRAGPAAPEGGVRSGPRRPPAPLPPFTGAPLCGWGAQGLIVGPLLARHTLALGDGTHLLVFMPPLNGPHRISHVSRTALFAQLWTPVSRPGSPVGTSH